MIRVREAIERGWPAVSLTALAVGLSLSNWLAVPWMAAAVAAVAATAATFRLAAPARLALVGLALAAAGLWWGGLRLHELDRSFLSEQIGRPAAAQVVVTGAAGRSPFAVRVPALVRRFDGIPLRERVLLELPAGRAPPQGAVLELRARPVAPRGPETGFDERGWLARRGIHVVLHASDSWQVVGRRGGIGGVGDRLRTAIADALGVGTSGERRSLVVGIVLGADEGIDPGLRDAFKASGLYHLLAVSGQNIVLIGFGVLGLATWPDWEATGHALAIVAILSSLSPSVGSRRSSVLRWPVAWHRPRGCCPGRASAGTRWPRGLSCCSPGRLDPCSSPAFSSPSLRSLRSSSRCRDSVGRMRDIRCRGASSR